MNFVKIDICEFLDKMWIFAPVCVGGPKEDHSSLLVSLGGQAWTLTSKKGCGSADIIRFADKSLSFPS